MPTIAPCLIHSHDPSGGPVVRLGVPLLDDYLEFLSGRCRPNTVLAVAYDLKVFFEVVGKAPKRVRPGDVLGFMTAQRTGQPSMSPLLQPVQDKARGVSARTLRRRLSSVSGCSLSYTFAVMWLPIRCPAGYRPAGSDNGPDMESHWSRSPGPCPGS